MNKTVPVLLLGVVLCAGFATSQEPDGLDFDKMVSLTPS